MLAITGKPGEPGSASWLRSTSPSLEATSCSSKCSPGGVCGTDR